jgi:hypothetical protein
MPACTFPEMTLRSPTVAPPIVLFGLRIEMPNWFGSATPPPGSTPM